MGEPRGNDGHTALLALPRRYMVPAGELCSSVRDRALDRGCRSLSLRSGRRLWLMPPGCQPKASSTSWTPPTWRGPRYGRPSHPSTGTGATNRPSGFVQRLDGTGVLESRSAEPVAGEDHDLHRLYRDREMDTLLPLSAALANAGFLKPALSRSCRSREDSRSTSGQRRA